MEPNMIDTPRDFERMLRGSGFSRTRAKAITAKGFRLQDAAPSSHEVQELLTEISARKERLEVKRAFRNRIQLFEGTTKSGFLVGTKTPPSVTFEIIPPFRGAIFDCEITFFTGKGPAVEQRLVRLHQNQSVDTFLFRREDPVTPGNALEGLRGLRFDRRTRFRLNYKSSGRDRGTGALPADTFTIIVR